MEMWKLIYQEELPLDIGPVRELLEVYSGIEPADVESHLYAIVSCEHLLSFAPGRGPVALQVLAAFGLLHWAASVLPEQPNHPKLEELES